MFSLLFLNADLRIRVYQAAVKVADTGRTRRSLPLLDGNAREAEAFAGVTVALLIRRSQVRALVGEPKQ